MSKKWAAVVSTVFLAVILVVLIIVMFRTEPLDDTGKGIAR